MLSHPAVHIAFILVTLSVILALFFLRPYTKLMIQAGVSGVPVRFTDLLRMRYQGVDMHKVVLCRIRGARAGIDLPVESLRVHALAGGDLENVVTAMISASNARIRLGWPTASAADLAGLDVHAAVVAAADGGLSEIDHAFIAHHGSRATIPTYQPSPAPPPADRPIHAPPAPASRTPPR